MLSNRCFLNIKIYMKSVTRLSIVNVKGSVVKSEVLLIESSFDINISSFSRGLYILKITSPVASGSYKFIKE
ncbi:T9SS type A sorting domain-containing protein [Cytophagaceae bacterium ABcell3]|nr:T9SS type A sorting domain-containing protein [Cytophagaceae bacterium ABcell3]